MAAAAASDFLQTLKEGRAEDAWERLTPATREQAYDSDADAFAADVAAADWSSLRWRSDGPVSDHDISWGVYLTITHGEVPAFLFERDIGGNNIDGPEQLQLSIQIYQDGSYTVAGQSMDVDHRER